MINSINILNGEEMLNYFRVNALDKDGIYIPFNEAMCVGNGANNLFSTEFINERTKAHGVSLREYNERTLKPLTRFLEALKYDKQAFVLWFDHDMFCQINLLTIMAYLDQQGFNKSVTLKHINHDYRVLSTTQTSVSGYLNLYKQVLLKHTIPRTNLKLSKEMERGIQLYLEYKCEKNEITDYIKQYCHLETKEFVGKLQTTFIHYGLGDTQYLELIKKVRDYKCQIG